MTKPENPLAFPSVNDKAHYLGMTLRDYFAAAALQGAMASTGSDLRGDRAMEVLAIKCYAIAEQMLKEREL